MKPQRETGQPAMKVMMVEDEAMIAMIMEDLLAELGCEVAGLFSAVQPALNWLGGVGNKPDAALLDVNLGGEQVYPVAEALLALSIPFAFATGYGAIDDDRFPDAPVLKKPLDFDELATVIDRLRRA